jgi:hypothetical protein
MPFHSIVAEPEELAALSSAFDAAWREINRHHPIDPLRVAAERERLGFLIVTLWKSEPVETWVPKAVEGFLAAADATSFMTDQADAMPAERDEASRREG